MSANIRSATGEGIGTHSSASRLSCGPPGEGRGEGRPCVSTPSPRRREREWAGLAPSSPASERSWQRRHLDTSGSGEQLAARALSALFLLGRVLIDLAGLKLNFVLDWMSLADAEASAHAAPAHGILRARGAAGNESADRLAARSWWRARGRAGARGAPRRRARAGERDLPAAAPARARPRRGGRDRDRFSLDAGGAVFRAPLPLHGAHRGAARAVGGAVSPRGTVARRSFGSWFAFFLVCAAIGWLRSTLRPGVVRRHGRARLLVRAARRLARGARRRDRAGGAAARALRQEPARVRRDSARPATGR